MNPIIWLLAGAFLGWLTSIIMRRRHSNLLLNIIIGMLGAFGAGYLIPSVFEFTPVAPGGFSLPALLIAIVGAVILLALFNFLRRENNVKDDVFATRWPQLRHQIHTRWGKLTEADVVKIDGSYKRLAETIQARYGCTLLEADSQIQRYLKSTWVDSDPKEAVDVHKETL